MTEGGVGPLAQGWKGEDRAWELFNEMLESGEANEFHVTVMLKVRGAARRTML